MLKNPNKSLRKLAQQTNISYFMAHKAVKKELNLYPYKISVVSELRPVDHEKHNHYCELFEVTQYTNVR